MNSTDDLQMARVCFVLTALAFLLGAGCNTNPADGGGGYDIGEGVSCNVPQTCDDYTAKNVRKMHRKLLRLFDQIEMSHGAGNEHVVIPVVQELEVMLNQCPRLVLPELIKQMQRPVHELQRANLAMVLGWYSEGKNCTATPLARLLDDPHALVRFHAARALLDLKDVRGVPVMLNEAAAHPSERVRERALEAISDFAGVTLKTRAEAVSWYDRR